MRMMTLSESGYQRALGDGLLLRWSTAADTDGIALLYGQVYRDRPDDPPNAYTPRWARDLMSGRHPHCGPGDFAVVEDKRTGAIVSSACLMSQAWEYAGIPVPMGRVELVATDPGYRRRGLVRAILELLHARSAALGHLAQGITGIEHFYRQFGYEYALDLGGWRELRLTDIAPLKDGETEPFRLRDATREEIPLLQRLDAREQTGTLVRAHIDAPYWRWVLEGMDPASGRGWRPQLIVDAGERAVGCVLTWRMRFYRALTVTGLSFDEDVPLLGALPALLRALREQAVAVPVMAGNAAPLDTINFTLGRAHPAYDALDPVLVPSRARPYAWYVRVADLPGLLRHLAPELERRLIGSLAAGYTGELTLDFYRDGLRLVFERGRLAAAEAWQRPLWGRAMAGFPPLVILQLIFGWRSLDELSDLYPDVWADDAVAPVLRALFPPRLSRVRPLD